jgi:hypothetical protein
VEGSKPKTVFKAYPIGFFHIDIAEVRTEEGKLHLLVAIDRTSKFAFAELHERVTRRVAADFLRRLAVAVPYRIHTVLTDNGTHFTEPTGGCRRPADIGRMRAAGEPFRCHSFELACADLQIEGHAVGQTELPVRDHKSHVVRNIAGCEILTAVQRQVAYHGARHILDHRPMVDFDRGQRRAGQDKVDLVEVWPA